MSSRLHDRLARAVKRAGSTRALYAQDATLSRRGVLTRTDRRARELARLGVSPGDTVGLCLGNVPDFLLLLMACSKLGAVAMPVDPTSGDRVLAQAARRRPLRAVIRRPRGPDARPPAYPHHRIQSRKRLAGSLLAADVLEPDGHPAQPLPPDAELLAEARGLGGILRDVVLTNANLDRRIEAAVQALDLANGPRLLCSHPLTVASFFDPAVLGWLGSDAQLVMAETASLDAAISGAGGTGHLVVVDTLRGFTSLARAAKAAGKELDLTPIAVERTVPRAAERAISQTTRGIGRQVLFLDELGLLGHRPFGEKTFVPSPGLSLRMGAAMEVGGNELLVKPCVPPVVIPEPEEDDPGTPADTDGWLHTGYAARFDRSGALVELTGRDDGLVWLEGRRACLDSIEDVMLKHRRVTWARADVKPDGEGAPEVQVDYCATGETLVDDIEEHAIAGLPPFMVPRTFNRRRTPPDL